MKHGEKHSVKTESPPEQKEAEQTIDEQCAEGTEKLDKEISVQDEEIMKLNKEVDTLKDLLQRRQADFENFRKRTIKAQEENRKVAIKDFAYDILNINDDLSRAIEASESISSTDSSSAKESLADGVKIIAKRLEDTLKKFGIIEIESENKPFDPNYHEAIEIESNSDVQFDTVAKVYQKGFKLDEYVVRTAKVKVAKPAPKPAADSCDGGNGKGEQEA
ncbi:MAG TPA: nucleotide exchange factor GrpE [Spirochaetota bacterium]|nr:nucleotide exchange factor GrpE [Spirochaetota bacterium]